MLKIFKTLKNSNLIKINFARNHQLIKIAKKLSHNIIKRLIKINCNNKNKK